MSAKPPATHLYIIRHGESYANVGGPVGGMRGDKGLTERGLAQAHALGERLAGGEIAADVLYSSTLPRTRQTAKFVSEALGLEINWDDEFHELRPGIADGLELEDVRQRYPEFSRFLHEVYTPIAPEGESWGSFQFRVSAALERLVNKHPGKRIVLVAHGGVIEVSFLHFLGLGPEVRRHNSFPAVNTAITHWRHAVAGERTEWQMVGHNDYWHLRELLAEERHAKASAT